MKPAWCVRGANLTTKTKPKTGGFALSFRDNQEKVDLLTREGVTLVEQLSQANGAKIMKTF